MRSSQGCGGGQRSRAGGKFRGKEMEEGGWKREGCRDAGESVGQGVLGMSAGEGGSIKLSQQRGREDRGCIGWMSEDSVGIAGWQGVTGCSRLESALIEME